MPKAARILLVDDRDDVRESIAEILTAAQYTVVAATDGEKALSILANDPSFDLLFTDIALGSRLSGYELAQRAVQLKPSLRVLYTTGYSWNLEDLHAAVPGSRMLRKPYRAHDLLREIDLLLDIPAPVVAPPDHAPPTRGTQKRGKPKPAILVVEDDERSRAIAVDLFEGLGLKVFSAGEAEDGLMILALHAEIVALFADIRLPGMSGSELAVEAWKMRPDLKVVLTSAYTDVQHVPGTRFLPKPWSKTDFTVLAEAMTRH